MLAKASEEATDDEVSDVLCGPSLHTSTSESIFPDTTYKSAAFDEDGNVLRHNFLSHHANASESGTETWECSTELCAIPPKEALVPAISATYVKIAKSDPADARDFIEHIDDCKNADTHDTNLQGHNKACHVDPDACGSILLYLRRLAPHFPDIRRIINMLYTVRRENASLCKIDNALETENVAALEEIIKQEKEMKRFNFTVSRDALDESKLRKDNAIAINAFNTHNLQLAEYPCISCMKLCFKREVTELAACKNPIEGDAWKQLLDHYETNPVVDDGLPTGYICDYCIKKFRAGVLPAGLLFENVPIEIAQLNPYEKVLIQRAKAFQVVTKMKMVAGKRLPPSHMVSKVRGSTFHLPLPLQETLKRLPTPDQPIPEHGELYTLFKLTASDYVKTIIQSRDSRFRLNQQFLFFLFHQATICQLSSGIYHKLKIMRPHERITAGRYLEMIQNEEIKGDLTSVFHRLRNSEQFWMRPRNDLNCMTLYYGPSPSEWAWNDLDEYLRKVNPNMNDLSTSALVAADPISASRFIENKRKAFIDFIMSSDNPIGKVTHYFCQREYQGRGLQHFHFAIWIDGAPILGDKESEMSDKERQEHNEKVVKFITKYVSCQIPNKTLSPILHDRVMKYQHH